MKAIESSGPERRAEELRRTKYSSGPKFEESGIEAKPRDRQIAVVGLIVEAEQHH
jgi:hypothetical protein